MPGTVRAQTSGGKPSQTVRPAPARPQPARTAARPAPGSTTTAMTPAVQAAVLQGPPRLNLDVAVAADELDLSTGELAVPEAAAAAVKEGGTLDAKVRLPGLAEGTLKLRKRGGRFSTTGAQAILLRHPALATFAASHPMTLALSAKDNVVSGFVGLGTPGAVRGDQRSLVNAIGKSADLVNWLGLSNLRFGSVRNQFVNGVIDVGVDGFGFTVGGFLSGSGSAVLDNQALGFEGSAEVKIPGGAGGELKIVKDATGALFGKLSIGVQIGGVTGSVLATLAQGFVSVMGSVGYSNERLSGKITLVATDKATAHDLTLAKPSGGDVPIELPGPDKPVKPGPRAFCGYGTITCHITDWLAGSASVLVNDVGQATVIGEIAPPKELILFREYKKSKRIFNFEVRAGYGIPVVGQVGMFASIGLDALATVGPGKLYDMKLSGAYSTDQRVPKNLTIEGAINISAFAGLLLSAKAGLVLTILGHDIKAGIALNALAGVRGYVEARPRIGMREQVGGQREFFIAGHLEIAAQPVLGFSGELFVAIETPWWSPLSDHKWSWPLFSIEYPLPGEFGIGADVDYVLGSGKWPSITFGEVDFDGSKFLSDLLDDNTDSGSGKEQKKQGEWQEGLGADGKGGAKNKGGAGKKAGELDDDIGPIGEEESFSDGQESHRLWFAQKGSDATLMMASGTPRAVAAHLQKWDEMRDMLADDDYKSYDKLAATAQKQLRTIDPEADQVAMMKVATRKAKEIYEKSKGKKGKKQKKGKDGAKELNKLVTKRQRELKGTLAALALLMHKVPFKVAPRAITLFGGTQTAVVVDVGGKAALRINKDLPSGLLLKCLVGPYARVKFAQGRDALNVAYDALAPLELEIGGAKVKQGQILGIQLVRLQKPLDKAVTRLTSIGQTLKVPSLYRAKGIGKIYPKKITFVFYRLPEKRSQNRLEREVRRQLDLQRDGLNEMTVDSWLPRVDAYRTKRFDTFDQLRDEEKRAVAAELAERAATARQEAEKTVRNLEAERKQALAAQRAAEKLLAQAQEEREQTTRARTAEAAQLRAAAQARLDQAAEQLRLARQTTTASTPGREVRLEAARQARQEAEVALERLGDLDVGDRAAAQQAITSAEVNKLHGGSKGRYENLDQFKQLHADALAAIKDDDRFLARWRGLVDGLKEFHFSVLHNPDQVAGGKGMYDLTAIKVVAPPGPEATAQHKKEWSEYLELIKAQVGSQYVNGRLGGFAGKGETREGWPSKVADLRQHVVGQGRTPAAYPIWRVNVALDPSYVVKPKESS